MAGRTEIMFQAFKWDATWNGRIGNWWSHLERDVLPILRRGSFTHVWLPPPSKCRAQDWVGYTPMDYWDLGEFRQWVQIWDEQAKRLTWIQHSAPSVLDEDPSGNPTGTSHCGTETLWGHRTALESLIRACHADGVACIADIVVNHRDPQQVNAQDEWICWASDEHSVASGKMAWGFKGKDDNPEEIAWGAGGAGEDDGEGGFAANIAHHSARARADIKAWLTWLRTLGFDGWRWDVAKGFGPEHVAEYNYHTGNPFSVGEYWDSNTQLIYNWIDGTDAYDPSRKSSANDFPLQEHLRKVFWGDKPFDQLGLWKYASVSIVGGWPEKAVTMLTNHDLCRKPFCGFPTDPKRLVQGHAFLLLSPGVPCVFFSDLLERGEGVRDAILGLCKLRHELGITRTSSVEVIRSAPACYAARVDGHVVLKIGDEFWNPGPGWSLKQWGTGWAVWTRC